MTLTHNSFLTTFVTMYLIGISEGYTKLIVTTGGGGPIHEDAKIGRKTEIIDLENTNTKCPDLPNFPIELRHAMSGLLDDVPYICGGFIGGEWPVCEYFCSEIH